MTIEDLVPAHGRGADAAFSVGGFPFHLGVWTYGASLFCHFVVVKARTTPTDYSPEIMRGVCFRSWDCGADSATQ